MAERQERVPVAPAEREHAKALHVRAADMVVDAGQQLYFLGAAAAEQRVVDDGMMAVPRSSVNLRQWMAQEFRKRKMAMTAKPRSL